MQLSKTIKIRVGDLTNIKIDIIESLLKKNVRGINHCIDIIEKKNIYHQTKLHHLVYKDLRKLDLPACVCHSIRQKSVEVMKSFKKQKNNINKPILKNSCVRFDNVQTQLIKSKAKLYPYFVSLLYKAGSMGKSDRINLPLIINSNYQKEIINKLFNNKYKQGSAELLKKNNKYYINLSYSKEVNIPEPDETFSPIGIDLGVNNLAVSVANGSVKFHNGKRSKWKRNFFYKQRRKLQQNLNTNILRQQRNNEWQWMTAINHNISDNIIKQAKQVTKPVIVLEDLKGIRKHSKKLSKSTRRMINSWAFRQLQDMITYKANWDNIPVEFINAEYSSQICNKCGCLGKRDKHSFKCNNCGYECNSDYNAGRNLQHFFIAKCKGEQATINMASNIDNSEPQATKIISVRNFNKEIGGNRNSSHS